MIAFDVGSINCNLREVEIPVLFLLRSIFESMWVGKDLVELDKSRKKVRKGRLELRKWDWI